MSDPVAMPSIPFLAILLALVSLDVFALTPVAGLWGANGPVEAVVVDESGANGPAARLYIGGLFDYVGPVTGSGVLVSADPANPALDARLATSAVVDGTVQAIVADGSGGWFIGGAFTSIDGQARGHLAHLLSDGSLDTTWTADTDGIVRALAVSGGRLYVGGDFARLAGGTRARLGAVDTVTGALDSTWQAAADASVRALRVSGGRLYVGGDFAQLAGGTRARLGAVDALTGGLISGWQADSDGIVRALAVSGDGLTLYVGGDFTTVGGQARRSLAATTTATGALTGWQADADAPVRALAVSSDGLTLYVGGDFMTLGGLARRSLAAVTTSIPASVTAFQADADAAVSALVVPASGNTLYVGGAFRSIAAIGRLRLAAIDLATGLPTVWAPEAGATVRALAWQSQTLMSGGDFASVGGQRHDNLAALDAVTGAVVPWSVSVDGRVRTLALAADGDRLFLGGDFTAVSGHSRARLAVVSTQTGLALPWVGDADGRVDAIVLSSDGVTLFVGGEFTTLAGQPRDRLAQVRTATGTVTFWRPAIDGPVRAVRRVDKTLYIGGGFTTALGQQRARIAAIDLDRLDLRSWSSGIDDGEVLDIIGSPTGDTVYAAGSFSQVDGAPAPFLAAFDSSQGAVVSTWRPAPDAIVRRLATSFDGSRLYLGGDFLSIAGQPRSHLAAINRFDAVPSIDWIPDTDDVVLALATDAQGTRVYTGGRFLHASLGLHGRLVAYPAPPRETDPPRTVASLPAGDYNGETSTPVSLGCDDGQGSGCQATYFTTDGSAPRAEPDFLYETPIPMSGDMTLRFFSVDRMGNREALRQAV